MLLLIQLLSALRALHWSHWTSHWKSSGPISYQSHLLFERLYTGVVDEIDGLAEKIVGEYGPEALGDLSVMAGSARFLSGHEGGDLVSRALQMEEHLQTAIKTAYEELKANGKLSLGMDDFLMALANSHETNIYLLRQNMRPALASSRVAAKGDPYWMEARFPGRDNKGRPFNKGDRVFYYPRTKAILTGPEAEQASRDMDSARFDEGY